MTRMGTDEAMPRQQLILPVVSQFDWDAAPTLCLAPAPALGKDGAKRAESKSKTKTEDFKLRHHHLPIRAIRVIRG